ncbi:MFS transporter [Granulosicoccus sp. 3-233]|uniref:MFS transporter n=1 Tax=Granulosicoccus sp. 3-233 TaxID=3417969 RepID=UPI003D34CC63
MPRTSTWTPEQRLTLYFMMMYGSVGLTGPFLSPWLHHLGVSAQLTGLIVAMPSVAMVVAAVHLGSISDRLSDWRTAIIGFDWMILLLFCWMLFRQNVIDIIVVWTLAGLLIAVKVPVLDGATLSLTRRRGSDYARIRALGSVGFVIALMSGGVIFNAAGLDWFVPALIAGALIRALCASVLPAFREAATLTGKRVDERLAAPADNLGAPAGNMAMASASITAPALPGGLKHPGFLMVIAGSALINGSHAFFGAFAMLHWIESGISTIISSLLWCFAVVMEIALMWRFTDVARRLSSRHCMLAAGAVGILRWSLSTMNPSVPLLVLLQGMHALSFGLLFIATVTFISRRVDDSMAARAQSLYATFATAALATAVLVSGILYSRAGIQGYWLMTAMCVVGMVLIISSYSTRLEEDFPV